MSETLSALLAPAIALVAVVFVMIRLRFFSPEHPDGRYLFVIGGLLVVIAAGWQMVKLNSEYLSWFVPQAYGYIDISQLLALALGVLLIAAALALYHDSWQSEHESVATRQGKLSVLEQLQQDARQPYQVVDLLSMGLREILLHWPECAGVVFLVHRDRRQFVLIDSARLDKQETALMEHLPLRRNSVAEALQDGQPVIGGSFTFTDRSGKDVPSRFNSSLALPLVSGMETMGGILLLSEESRSFTREDVKVLAPVAGWLAERAKSARLGREVSTIRRQLEEERNTATDFAGRVAAIVASFDSDDAISVYCRGLVGFGASVAVHVCGIRNGGLVIHGGSEAMLDLSENFRTALVGALDRRKPLILNQEASDETGQAVIVSSTLVFPLPDGDSPDALMLRKDAPPFVVDDAALKRLELFARMARTVLARTDGRRLDLTRRIGFDKVLHLLTTEELEYGPSEALMWFARQVTDISPQKTLALTFRRDTRGSMRAEQAIGCEISRFELEIAPGEGTIGQSVAEGRSSYVVGKKRVGAEFSAYRSEAQAALAGIAGERGLPDLLAVCPIRRFGEALGAVVFYFHGVPSDQVSELQRLLTLAAGLYSLRLSVSAVRQRSLESEAERIGRGAPGDLVNRINNALSAILGSAELAAARDDIPGEARRHMKSVIGEVEQLAALVRRSLGSVVESTRQHESAHAEQAGLAGQITRVLDEARISGNVFMAGGRPREIDVRLDVAASSVVAEGEIRGLFEGAINRFAALTKDEEIITVAAYQAGDFVYLDLSRHPRNFPPVRQVAGFGDYRPASEALRERPGDVFLDRVKDEPCYYAHDRHSDTPTFLSFKFPVHGSGKNAQTLSRLPDRGALAVLAIDDEAIILDLVSAMCHSLGYEAVTAGSGEEGLRLARSRRFDVVLTDLAMPGLSGLDVAREVHRLHPGLPIVLVTGWQASVDRQELTAAGISHVLSKPFRIEQLTEILQAVATQKR